MKKWFIRVMIFFSIYVLVGVGISKVFEEKNYMKVEVQPGDSIWKISSSVASESTLHKGTKEVSDWIIKKNHIWDAKIKPGQLLIIPVEEKHNTKVTKLAYED